MERPVARLGIFWRERWQDAPRSARGVPPTIRQKRGFDAQFDWAYTLTASGLWPDGRRDTAHRTRAR